MAKGFPYRILLVDDDEALPGAREAILSEAGYVVRTARDGFEALALLQGSVPELLITDQTERNPLVGCLMPWH